MVDQVDWLQLTLSVYTRTCVFICMKEKEHQRKCLLFMLALIFGICITQLSAFINPSFIMLLFFTSISQEYNRENVKKYKQELLDLTYLITLKSLWSKI